jgi:hypothetical protein
MTERVWVPHPRHPNAVPPRKPTVTLTMDVRRLKARLIAMARRVESIRLAQAGWRSDYEEVE